MHLFPPSCHFHCKRGQQCYETSVYVVVDDNIRSASLICVGRNQHTALRYRSSDSQRFIEIESDEIASDWRWRTVLLRKAIVWELMETLFSSLVENLSSSPAGAMVARKTSIRSFLIERDLEAVGSSPTWGFSFCPLWTLNMFFWL
jgi:hypothetical protein